MNPLFFLMHILSAKFSKLGDDVQQRAMWDLFDFSKKPGETVGCMLSRFHVVSQRAAVDGRLQMTIQHLSLIHI